MQYIIALFCLYRHPNLPNQWACASFMVQCFWIDVPSEFKWKMTNQFLSFSPLLWSWSLEIDCTEYLWHYIQLSSPVKIQGHIRPSIERFINIYHVNLLKMLSSRRDNISCNKILSFYYMNDFKLGSDCIDDHHLTNSSHLTETQDLQMHIHFIEFEDR